jgi:hypothetical protein
MLAYVFWHAPEPGIDRAAYETFLRAFHGALAEHAPEGFAGSASYRAEGPGPVEGDAYEDWYLVENWAALGTLDAGAVTGPRREPHDAVARHAADGAGGVYRLLRGDPTGRGQRTLAWLTKPRGVPYDDFLAELAPLGGASLWQRQLVLGPRPEFCLAGLARRPALETLPPAWKALVVERTPIWPEPAP